MSGPGTSYTLSRRRFGAALAGVIGLAALGGCAASSSSTSSGDAGSSAGSTIFDSGTVHDIELTFEDSAYDTMIAAYLKDETKDWIETAVSIDGTTYEKAGLRLKGNSSLRGLNGNGNQPGGAGISSDNPEDLPWLIRLDKYVDGQAHQGYTDFVVRSNNTSSALNEAVALELLGQAGLATEKSFSTRLSVNGGTEVLRLIVENPGDKWDADNFPDAGLLYKAEANGDYSYRGDDAASYDDVFDQEAGDDDLKPLIAFLKFINESDDATFGSDLGKYLDVDAFAKYLAFQELVQNSDDIDGPGNNSYLRYTTSSKIMTVVNWDLNLAFGGMGGGGGMRGGGQQDNAPATAPSGAAASAASGAAGSAASGAPGSAASGAAAQGGAPATSASGAASTGDQVGGGFPGGGDQAGGGFPGGGKDGGRGGFGGRSNILVTRFQADETFAAKYTAAQSDLKAALYTSGAAKTVLDRRAAVLTSQAGDLVSADTVTSEAAKISAFFTS